MFGFCFLYKVLEQFYRDLPDTSTEDQLGLGTVRVYRKANNLTTIQAASSAIETDTEVSFNSETLGSVGNIIESSEVLKESVENQRNISLVHDQEGHATSTAATSKSKAKGKKVAPHVVEVTDSASIHNEVRSNSTRNGRARSSTRRT